MFFFSCRRDTGHVTARYSLPAGRAEATLVGVADTRALMGARLDR